MFIALLSAKRSKDPNTQVGAWYLIIYLVLLMKIILLLDVVIMDFQEELNVFHGIEKDHILKLNIQY